MASVYTNLMNTKHILLVEDNKDLSNLLEMTLTAAGYTVAIEINDKGCMQAIESCAPDLIILDINLNLPGINGLDLCREIRKSAKTPILILSGSTEDVDKILALELGANNYLSKPINPKVLVSYIKRMLSDLEPVKKDELLIHAGDTYHFATFILDPDGFLLTTTDGKRIEVSPAEFKLLCALVLHPNRILTRDALIDYTSIDGDVYDRSIDRLISRLRKKIEVDIKNPQIIKSIYSQGYIFEADVIKKQSS